MTDHDADVAAVLAEALERFKPTSDKWSADRARVVLAALTANGYAVVKLPEGVTVVHGARLVPRTVNLANMEVDLYAIDDTP